MVTSDMVDRPAEEHLDGAEGAFLEERTTELAPTAEGTGSFDRAVELLARWPLTIPALLTPLVVAALALLASVDGDTAVTEAGSSAVTTVTAPGATGGLPTDAAGPATTVSSDNPPATGLETAVPRLPRPAVVTATSAPSTTTTVATTAPPTTVATCTVELRRSTDVHEAPDEDSPELDRADDGRYRGLAQVDLDRRWFLIDLGDTVGWVTGRRVRVVGGDCPVLDPSEVAGGR